MLATRPRRTQSRRPALLIGLSVIALLLSLTAIYAVTAFTVSRRTPEIGLRMKLGAEPRRVIGEVLRRPLAQVGLGVMAGGLLVTITFASLFESTPTTAETALLAAYSLLLMGVCLLACVVPTRRALRVEPARALVADSWRASDRRASAISRTAGR